MPRVTVIGMPPSRDSSVASSSLLASMASAMRSSTSVRSCGFMSAQDGSSNARRAAATARSTSAGPPDATVARTEPVAGIDRLERLARLGLRPLPADQHALRGRALDEAGSGYLADFDRLRHWLTSPLAVPGQPAAQSCWPLAATLMHTILYANARPRPGFVKARLELPRSLRLVRSASLVHRSYRAARGRHRGLVCRGRPRGQGAARRGIPRARSPWSARSPDRPTTGRRCPSRC